MKFFGKRTTLLPAWEMLPEIDPSPASSQHVAGQGHGISIILSLCLLSSLWQSGVVIGRMVLTQQIYCTRTCKLLKLASDWYLCGLHSDTYCMFSNMYLLIYISSCVQTSPTAPTKGLWHHRRVMEFRNNWCRFAAPQQSELWSGASSVVP